MDFYLYLHVSEGVPVRKKYEILDYGHLLWASDLDLEYYWIWCFSRIV